MSPFQRFRDVIRDASDMAIRADPTLAGGLVMDRLGDLVVSYAPFEHVESRAKIVLVGITPGAQQAANALSAARAGILAGLPEAEILAKAKVFASFSGPMRTNLVHMLDAIGVAQHLRIASTASLWTEHAHLAHFTSAQRYPVFAGGENYGGTPPMIGVPMLRSQLDTSLREEAAALPQALWVPLGPKPAAALRYLVDRGALDADRVLEGLPHPSGANAERIAYFLGRKAKHLLSSKTDARTLDAAKARLLAQVARS